MSKRPFTTFFAAAMAVGMSAASALAQSVYYPGTNSPLDTSNELVAIQAILQGTANGGLGKTTESLQKPPPAGFVAFNSSDFAKAVGIVIKNVDAGTPGFTNITVNSVSQAAAQYSPGNASKAMAAIAAQLVTDGKQGSVPGAVSAAVGASDNSGKYAASIAGAAVGALALSAPGAADEGTATGDAVSNTPGALAGAVVAAALGDSKKSPGQEVSIVTAGLQAATGAGATISQLNTIVLDSIAGTIKLKADGPTVTAVMAAILQNVPVSEVNAVQIAAAAAAGTNAVSGGVATNIPFVQSAVDAVGSPFATDKTVMDTAIQAYLSIEPQVAANKSNKAEAGTAAAAYFTAHPTAAADAVAAAAVQASLANAGLTINQVLTSNPGTATPVQIVIAGVLANQANAAKDAAAIINNTTHGGTVSSLTGALVQATTEINIGPTVLAATKALATASNYTNVAIGAVQGAETANYNNAIGQIALNVAKEAGSLKQANGAINTLNAILGAANLASFPVEAAEATAGTVAADKTDAGNGNILTAVNTALSGNAKAKALADVAATLGNNIINYKAPKGDPKDPLNFLEYTNQALAQAPTGGATAAQQAEAIVATASQIVPTAIDAIVGTALVSLGGADEANLVAVGTAGSFKLAPNVQAAADATIFAFNNGQTGLFDYIRDHTITNPNTALDVAIGATLGQPSQAHIIGHAFAFADPAAASKVVPALFSYTLTIPSPTAVAGVIPGKTGGGNADLTARAAAITAGVIDGVIEGEGVQSQATAPSAKTVSTTASILKATVSAAVKAAVNLTDPNITFAIPTAGSVPENGSAAVTTAYISQAYNPVKDNLDFNATGSATVDGQTNATIEAILNAAGKAAGKTYLLSMAYAAAQAAAEVYINKYGEPNFAADFVAGTSYQAIVTALQGFNGGPDAPTLTQAVNAGATAAETSTVGFGSAGVVGYQTRPVSGQFVTSIYEL